MSQVDDPQLFERFVRYSTSIGKSVAIASYGNKDVILTILSRIFGQSKQCGYSRGYRA